MRRIIGIVAALLCLVQWGLAGDVTVEWQNWDDDHLYDSSGTDMRTVSNRFELILDVNGNTDVAEMIASNYIAIAAEAADTAAYGSDDDVTLTARNTNWQYDMGFDFGYVDGWSLYDETLYASTKFYFRFYNHAQVDSASEAGLVYSTGGNWVTPADALSPPTSIDLARTGSESADLAGSVDGMNADGWATMAGSIPTAPEIAIVDSSPKSLGTVAVGLTNNTQYITVTNSGTAVLNITNFTWTGHSAEFVLRDGGGSPTGQVAAGSSTNIYISFAPTNTGARQAVLYVLSDDTNTPSTNITIQGTGKAAGSPSVTNDPAATVGQGTATLYGTVTSTGGVALSHVRIYWGDNDGGETHTWDNTAVIDETSVSEGVAFSTNLTGLYYGIEYNYRTYASNQFGQAWSGNSTFLTEVPTESTSYTSSGSYTPSVDGVVDVLVVAGGGSGGSRTGGGGAAGGLIHTQDYAVVAGSNYTVTVGAGGAARTGYNQEGLAGANSAFGALVAIGGGGGAANAAGSSGGSGGGGSRALSGASGTAGQGYAGGDGNGNYGGGGGGGAGGVGVGGGTGGIGTDGGPGVTNSITGSPVVYAAGGGGGSYDQTTYGLGGSGGVGGRGAAEADTILATAGAANTGSGGGGGGGNSDPYDNSGAGADGIVIVRSALFPTITNTAASDVTSSSATIEAILDGKGSVYDVYAYWKTNGAASWEHSDFVGSYTNAAPTNLAFVATNLLGGTSYDYTFQATNAATNIWATPNAEFTTSVAGAPEINNTNGATNVQATNAYLNGTLTTTGAAPTTVWAYYGTTDGTNNKAAWTTGGRVGTGSGAMPQNFATNVTGLSGSTTYYYRFYATNTYGDDWSATAQFTTKLDTSGYLKKMKITFSGYSETETLTNFPALVVLSNNVASGFSYGDFGSDDGYDLRFFDPSETTELNYETEEWNTGGVSYVWVQVPELTNSCHIWAYWDNASLAASPAAYTTNGATWSEDYELVQHLNEASGTHYDSTANAHDSSGVGGDPTEGATGLIGPCVSFDGNDYVDIPNDATRLWDGIVKNSTFTLSAIVKSATANYGNYAKIVDYGEFAGGGFGLHARSDDKFNYYYNDNLPNPGAGIAVDITDWHHLVLTFSGGTLRYYNDGVEVDSLSSAVELDNYSNPFRFGGQSKFPQAGRYWNGLIDEVRVMPVARSANWVMACYSNQKQGSTFATYDTVADLSPATLFIFK